VSLHKGEEGRGGLGGWVTYVQNDEGFSLTQTISLEVLGARLEYFLINAPYHLSNPI
jgi:hypothetical protein